MGGSVWGGARMDSSAYFNLISLSSFCVSQTAAPAVEELRPMFGHGHIFFLFFPKRTHSESPNT